MLNREMSRRRRLNPKEDARCCVASGKDKQDLDVKFISSFKGRGVFAGAPFEKGDFLLEYRGELISQNECERRQRLYHDKLKNFMFEFRYDGKFWCVDAAKEDDSLGRLVNDDHINPNARMKYLKVDGKPHLCLFARRDIQPGEEITYSYGDSDWPWRAKESVEKSSSDQRSDTSTSELTTEESTATEDSVECFKKPPDVDTSGPSEAEHPEESLVEREDSSLAVSHSDPSPGWGQSPSSEKAPDVDMSPGVSEAGQSEHCPKHRLLCITMTAFDRCLHCLGPLCPFPWVGFKCKVCHGIWHRSCYRRANDEGSTSDLDEQPSSGSEYVPESDPDVDSNSNIPCRDVPRRSEVGLKPKKEASPRNTTSDILDTSVPDEAARSRCQPPSAAQVHPVDVSDSTPGDLDATATESSDSTMYDVVGSSKKQVLNQDEKDSTSLNLTIRNYCFICKKPQSRLIRHLKTHMSHPEVAYAFYLPEDSKERKVLFEKMRNRGNFKHNCSVLQGGTGPLKVKRKPKTTAAAGRFVHCMHCQGLYVRKELWRHVKRCPCRPENTVVDQETGRNRVLAKASAQKTVFSQQFSSEMWKILSSMKMDDVGDLAGLKGKSLDDFEIEDEMSCNDAEADDSGSGSEDSSTEAEKRQPEAVEDIEQAQTSEGHEIPPEVTTSTGETATSSEGQKADRSTEATRPRKMMWTKPEVAAVMRHFAHHIAAGKLASKSECSQCQQAEDPVLSQRSVQNIRDFVRNRIITNKRQAQMKR